MEDGTQEKRPICGRGLDVVCIDGDTLQATEFVMYVPIHEIETCRKLARDAGEELVDHTPMNTSSNDNSTERQKYVLKVNVVCNGELVVNSLTGTSEDVAVIEPSGRIAFVTPDGGHSYFAPSEILSDMNLMSTSTNLIELKVKMLFIVVTILPYSFHVLI